MEVAMYRISADTIISGDLAAVWTVVTDVDSWATWDPHEEEARLDEAFALGGTGWSKPRGGPGTLWTITEVIEQRRWSTECALPGGKLTGQNDFEQLGDGRIQCAKTVSVTGPLVPLFRLYFGRRIRRDIFKTWAALERAAAVRAEMAS
jgi:hypothetical protein